MKTLNCIIVDDEELDRLMAVSFIKRFPFLNLIGVFNNAHDALKAIEKEKIDVAF